MKGRVEHYSSSQILVMWTSIGKRKVHKWMLTDKLCNGSHNGACVEGVMQEDRLLQMPAFPSVQYMTSYKVWDGVQATECKAEGTTNGTPAHTTSTFSNITISFARFITWTLHVVLKDGNAPRKTVKSAGKMFVMHFSLNS